MAIGSAFLLGIGGHEPGRDRKLGRLGYEDQLWRLTSDPSASNPRAEDRWLFSNDDLRANLDKYIRGALEPCTYV